MPRLSESLGSPLAAGAAFSADAGLRSTRAGLRRADPGRAGSGGAVGGGVTVSGAADAATAGGAGTAGAGAGTAPAVGVA